MLTRLRSHISSNLIGYLALFVALGGTSYAFATGSIDSREIKNNTVRTGDLRNNDVRSRDIRNRTLVGRDHLSNSLGGEQIAEARLGKVPSAASADDALALAGRPASAFAAAPVAISRDLPESTADVDLLAVPGFGTLVVTNCDPSADGEARIAYRNESSGGQTVFIGFTPHHDLDPLEESSSLIMASGTRQVIVHVGQQGNPARQATIFVAATFTPDVMQCRVLAQALVSG